ncbi:glycoside hydrolase family 128 protein [Trametes coccinea BRFM310]|uniref:Glycoside hydrolase family 128 protein n=1 Tax=Trametes coccinea (strain BRFM310) TaxID=1353009 RepID=A0A1Y2IDF4_TRAC3|nr:glycoside hydrolase family 128 protein [Trametes coccinea BRFM310]
MASKLLNLVALSSLAIMACTFGAAPTTALSTGHLNHANRHVAHAPIAAKKKRDQSKRCKARPSTSLASSTAAHTSSSVHAQAAAVTTSSSHSQAPASTTKSSAPATTSKASSGGSSTIGTGQFGKAGSKICAAWGNGNDPSLANFKTDHVVALYDWGVDKPSDADKLGFMYMPMLWGGSQDKINAFEAAIKPGLGSIILGFNEPNEQGQSNMDPQTAAALWKQHIEPKRSMGYKFCSPAMSSRPNGFQWMQEFMAACDGCNVDMQCLHWYDIGFDTLQTYLTKYHDEFKLPIMLTEFAEQNFNGGAQATMDEIWDFMGQALKWFDETDWILAACPFGIMHDLQGVNTLNLLQNSDGSPTALGSFVINDGNN